MSPSAPHASAKKAEPGPAIPRISYEVDDDIDEEGTRAVPSLLQNVHVEPHRSSHEKVVAPTSHGKHPASPASGQASPASSVLVAPEAPVLSPPVQAKVMDGDEQERNGPITVRVPKLEEIRPRRGVDRTYFLTALVIALLVGLAVTAILVVRLRS